MAGLHLGNALLAPGQRTRLLALRQNAVEVVPILYGIVLMLLIAAIIEAFWSSKRLLPEWKIGVGALCWAMVGLYFWRSGREVKTSHEP